MSQQDEAEKSLEPSARKLEESRKKGEIARSADILVATGYGGLFLVAVAIGPVTLFGFGDALIGLIDRPDVLAREFFADGSSLPVGQLIGSVIWPVLPWVTVPALLVVAVLIASRGLLFTPSKLKPKGSRLSVIQNAKNKYGRSGLFEFAKSFTKLMIYSLALALFLSAELPRIAGSLQGGAHGVMQLMGGLVLRFMGIVVVIAAVIGGIDFMWQRQEHLRRNRMSHKEMRDEFKDTEGDPAMKQHRRAQAQEIAMNQMMADVPKASVVIVNPTHYAVALRWDRASGGAPVCVAKGVDATAARIREVAEASKIPIHSDPPTARALYAMVEIGHQVSADHYRAVAAAIRFADDMRRKARARGGRA
ncbi:EscU/YscU/HrcU family type III secretion system export apparatus switch protein [Thalassococcus sp. BH17M4-6]|uniref:EscU/YscU/HrcU family type III secretion system export apparatus switch protein n=1 Tax=Thalassococcus sp. BH17M4-6 TaxID=3413148 RepID=UPI003BDB3570